jgi:hypothetical protein
MTGIEIIPFIWVLPVAVAMLARDSAHSECRVALSNNSRITLDIKEMNNASPFCTKDPIEDFSVEVTLNKSKRLYHESVSSQSN